MLCEIKKYFLWFYLLIKRLLKKTGIWVIVVLLPWIFAFYVNSQSSDDSQSMRVGLVLQDSDEIAQKTVENLVNGQYSVNFYIENEKDKLIEDINNEKSVCGYIFSEKLTNRLDTLNIKECINVVIPSSDFMSSMINEIVFSELFKAYGGNIAINNINSSQLFGVYNEEAITSIEDKYSVYADGDRTFHIDFENVNSDSSQSDITENADNGLPLFSIRGMLAVILVVAGLTGCVWWNTEKKRGMFKAMSALECYLGAFLYVVAVTFIVAISALVVIFITGEQTGSITFEILNMGRYVFLIGGMGTLLCAVVRDKMLLISFIPVYAIFCMIMCPVFFDLGAVVPAIKYVRWGLVPFYF